MDDLTSLQYSLERLREGSLLSEIAEELGMKRTTLYTRLLAQYPADVYARAREDGLHARGERLNEMTRAAMPLLASGGIDPAAVSQLKLQLDVERWTLAKLLPKVYGDKLDVTVEDVTDRAALMRQAREKRLSGD